jgi:hypothetical protein
MDEISKLPDFSFIPYISAFGKRRRVPTLVVVESKQRSIILNPVVIPHLFVGMGNAGTGTPATGFQANW